MRGRASFACGCPAPVSGGRAAAGAARGGPGRQRAGHPPARSRPAAGAAGPHPGGVRAGRGGDRRRPHLPGGRGSGQRTDRCGDRHIRLDRPAQGRGAQRVRPHALGARVAGPGRGGAGRTVAALPARHAHRRHPGPGPFPGRGRGAGHRRTAGRGRPRRVRLCPRLHRPDPAPPPARYRRQCRQRGRRWGRRQHCRWARPGCRRRGPRARDLGGHLQIGPAGRGRRAREPDRPGAGRRAFPSSPPTG